MCAQGRPPRRNAEDQPREEGVHEDLEGGRDGLPHGVEVLQEEARDDANGGQDEGDGTHVAGRPSPPPTLDSISKWGHPR